MINTTIDITSQRLYFADLQNRTFSLLYMYEQQPFEIYQKHLFDLISGVSSFQKYFLNSDQNKTDFCKYLENLVAIINPEHLKQETEHKFIRRHILNATNILGRIVSEFNSGVANGKQ